MADLGNTRIRWCPKGVINNCQAWLSQDSNYDGTVTLEPATSLGYHISGSTPGHVMKPE